MFARMITFSYQISTIIYVFVFLIIILQYSNLLRRKFITQLFYTSESVTYMNISTQNPWLIELVSNISLS